MPMTAQLSVKWTLSLRCVETAVKTVSLRLIVPCRSIFRFPIVVSYPSVPTVEVYEEFFRRAGIVRIPAISVSPCFSVHNLTVSHQPLLTFQSSQFRSTSSTDFGLFFRESYCRTESGNGSHHKS